ncbi:MAG: hypothetical protein JWO83_3039 [Caulobacteraceae bacterium]|nr:hypothetical protein [Caulobacteraceae bacterium]
MPTLRDPRHEAFAQARARGALLIDAYESAGFVRHRGHPSRLALKDEVADRIAELRASQTEAEDVSPAGLLASLRRIIKAGENSENTSLVNAARLAIVDASRIQAELARHQAHEREHLDWVFNDLQAREAAEAAARAAAERPSPPARRPPAPRRLPESAPRAPHKLLDSAARSPLVLPGLSPATPARHCLSVLPAASLAPGTRATRIAPPNAVSIGRSR